MANRKKNPDVFVHVEDCRTQHKTVAEWQKTIELALFGEDRRGGIVKDLQEIKSATSAVKTVVVPIIVSVISALITAGIIQNLR